MKIVTWNMGFNAFKAVHDDAWRYLLSLDPDIALVQEANVPHDLLGASNVIIGDSSRGRPTWKSAIVSPRLKLATLDPSPVVLPESLAGYVAAGTLTLPGLGRCLVASVHASPRALEGEVLSGFDPGGSRASVGPWYSDLIFATLNNLRREFSHFIIGGDWNEARLWDSVHGGTAGNEFFDRMTENEWVRCGSDETPTFFGHGTHYQTDHVFVDKNFLPVEDCHVLSREVAGPLSDHAPLLVRFQGDVGR